MIPSQRSDLAGLWQRLHLEADGIRDETTRVLWFQGAELYADLRIPADWPDPAGAASLSELDAATLLSLARAEGFAGRITLADGICTWAREINLAGPETGIDAGRLHITGDRMVEDGVHGAYSELWQVSRDGPVRSRRLADSSGRLLFAIWDEGRFTLARGHPAALTGPPRAAILSTALATSDPAALAAAFAMEISHGTWRGGEGIVTLSTNPLRTGRPACTRAALEAPAPVLEETDFTGIRHAIRWEG